MSLLTGADQGIKAANRMREGIQGVFREASNEALSVFRCYRLNRGLSALLSLEEANRQRRNELCLCGEVSTKVFHI